ncbi:DUF6461 domain-containing protein [Streptosporangium sp. NPDC006013]|uniref:DUF6461 domain-containing protein n=1 Tax=Streptosporangium sp. NPDC006013 TaxID=3155596 RepID=UPI0033BE1999
MQSPTHLHDLLVSTIFTEGLDDEMDLWTLGFSALWVKGMDRDAVAEVFSLDLVTSTPSHLNELLDNSEEGGPTWVGEAGGWTCIIPGPTDDDFLLPLTAGGREALCFSMDMGGHDHFKYLKDGEVVVAFQPTWPDPVHGSDPHALDHLMEGLRFQTSGDDVIEDRVDEGESISSVLTLIGRITGTDIAADWLEATHSLIYPR